jgi:hypothetical protein
MERIGEKERVWFEFGGACESLAGGLLRDVEEQHSNTRIGEMRGDLRAHGACAEHGRLSNPHSAMLQRR